MVEGTENQSDKRTLEQILHAAAELASKHHDEVEQYCDVLKRQGIDTELKLSDAPDALLLSKKVDLPEAVLRNIRKVMCDGQLATEFMVANSRGAQKRIELGPFDQDSYAPVAKKRVFKPKHTCADGKKYEGHWSEDGMRDGYGIYAHAEGALYEGYWENNAFHGKGRMIDRDGGVYEGDWVAGKKEGYGVYYYIGGGKYEGHWEGDLKKGHGVQTWVNGNKYDGEWMDKRHGKGTYTYANGIKRSAYYENGNRLRWE